MRRNKELPFERFPDDNEAVPILSARKNTVKRLQNKVKLNRQKVVRKQHPYVKKKSSKIPVESSSDLLSQDVGKNSLSVICEELSIEEEEKTPVTLKAKMKKVNNVDVNQ